MSPSDGVSVNGARRQSSQIRRPRNDSHTSLYRRGSNFSDASFMTDVEMAHDEVFAGPMSESVPTSVTSFAHRRTRAGSSASFTYFDEDQERSEPAEDEVVIDDSDDEEEAFASDPDLEAGGLPLSRRKSSGVSRSSAANPLLARHESSASHAGAQGRDVRTSQKTYILTEDLTIVIAGFSTSTLGYAIYLFLCVATLGVAYLLLRWLPRWRIRLTGSPTSLRHCTWVVIENQWGEFTTHPVTRCSYGREMSTVFGTNEKDLLHDYDENDDPVIHELRYLDYRYIRFCFHPLQDRFVLSNSWKDPSWTDARTIRAGLEGDERDMRELAFHPFYVFQIASLLLWSLDEYYYYAACIFTISVVSITSTLIETRSVGQFPRPHHTPRSFLDNEEIEGFVQVRLRYQGLAQWLFLLVPGDVYEITDPSLTQIPCDSLLLSGDCIVNESMLTEGESVPVSKIPATDESIQLLDLAATSIQSELARHFLFSGTKIVRARRPQDDQDDEAVALAMVLRTGFNTTKGALVRSMLFPKPSGFKFYRDSFRYISVMAGVAGMGFIVSFINFIRLKLAWHLIVVRALDLITIVVPPALPATLTIGTNFALSRLKKKGIYCISPQRVNVGGKLDAVCFDKTGTLTEDGLDVLGIRVVERPSNRFSELLPDAPSLLPGTPYERDPTIEYGLHQAVLQTMATCHSLRRVDEELVGDPLDLKMFEFTGWSFDEGEQLSSMAIENEPSKLSPSVVRPPPGMEFNLHHDETHTSSIELGILKAFEFVSQLRRASVVVRQYGASEGDVYVKGAPECMKSICRPDSFPPDYDDLLAYYTHRGFRVIACATRHIPKLSWLQVQKMKRPDAEVDLDFTGFIIFENKLKPSTAGVLKELSNAGIRKIMCTGDNILTAISVARECGLIDPMAHCFVPHFIEGDAHSPKARLKWESVDHPLFQLDESTLMPLPPPAESDASLPYDITNLRSYSAAVPGDVFRWIVDYESREVLQRMLACGQIYARMSPDEKHELVEKLQSIDYCCGFCGDGANDCGALKAADVGISLSEAEASVAAPFTSRVFDISCVPEVIREGRAALVTSFSCFKYMSLYSAIQFTSVSFLYASASNLGDFQFLFIDLLLILPIAIFMGWTGACPIMARKRPTASLVSRKVLMPLIGQILLCVAVQTIGFEAVRRQPWFLPPKLSHKKSNIENSENTTLFLVSCYQYILSGVVLSVGPPFRRSMTGNVPFVVTIVVTFLFATYLLLDPALWLQRFMQLTYLSRAFKLYLLMLALGWFACSWLAEKYVLPRLAKVVGRAKQRLRPKHQHQRKQYKLLQEEMRL
ncbi:MAG: hypothetical protein M1817_006514 [Caeruleum heppii]|nr:MAG: hypothetical protein M1817_006514 [Caeruleum heppii]